MAHGRLRLTAPALVIPLAFVAGCANDPAPTQAAPTSTAPAIPRADGAEVEAEIVEAYLGFWDAVFAAHSPPNPDHPDLARYAAGGQLEATRQVAAQDLRDGIGVRHGDPPTRHEPQVLEVAGNAAVVVDCWLDTDVLYDLDSETVIDDRQVWTFGRFRLARMDGAWKVERSDMQELPEEGSCRALARESS